jgi:hypothetical protein
VPDEIKYMDLDEFYASGYLQEANRGFFHPHGLALEMYDGLTKESLKKVLEEYGVKFGSDAIENCWVLVMALKLDKNHFGGVWDYREDPEGMVFGEELSAEKARIPLEELKKHIEARVRLFETGLGRPYTTVIQPIDLPVTAEMMTEAGL